MIEPSELRGHLLVAIGATVASLPADATPLELIRTIVRYTVWRTEQSIGPADVPRSPGSSLEDMVVTELASALAQLPRLRPLRDSLERELVGRGRS